MDKTENELLNQTKKWLVKLQKKRQNVSIESPNKGLATAIKNLDAYIADAGHFIEKKDYIRSFEAVIYAWGILETLEWLDLI